MATDDTHQEIEEAFMASWDRIERFYVRTFFWRTPLADIDPSEVKTLADSTEYKSRYEKLKPRLGLIAEMRKQGYDRQLRAGSSLSSLVLSRSREFGLRPDQAMLRITLSIEGGMNVSYLEKSNPPFEINTDTESWKREGESRTSRPPVKQSSRANQGVLML